MIVVTANTAAAAFRIGTNAARGRMYTLMSFGFADLLDDGEVPYRWLVKQDERQPADAG